MKTLTYTLDTDDVIVSVNEHWNHFALENMASDLTAITVLGKSIWEFISDLTTSHIYRICFDRVRKYQQPMSIPFRCDSPTIRRYMELSIINKPSNALFIQSLLLEQEMRPFNPLLIPPGINRSSNAHITMCSWCKSVRRTNGEWLDIDTALNHLKLMEESLPPVITHGICPGCYVQFNIDIGYEGED